MGQQSQSLVLLLGGQIRRGQEGGHLVALQPGFSGGLSRTNSSLSTPIWVYLSQLPDLSQDRTRQHRLHHLLLGIGTPDLATEK